MCETAENDQSEVQKDTPRQHTVCTQGDSKLIRLTDALILFYSGVEVAFDNQAPDVMGCYLRMSRHH